MEKGLNAAFYAVQAPQLWFDTPKGAEAWKPYFDAVGYKGDVVRF
jgi:hypothetical protein